MVLEAPTATGEDRWKATVPAEGKVSGLWMAYNPTNRFINVDGRLLAGLLADERAYTNIQGRTFDAFKPQIHDEICFSIDDLDATSKAALASIESGDILEAKAGQSTLTRVAKATGATADTTAFVIERIEYEQFAKAGIGVDKVPFFRCVCIAE